MVRLRTASFRLSSRKSFARRSAGERSRAGSSCEEPLAAEELDLLKQNSKLASEARPRFTTLRLSPWDVVS